MSSYLSAGLSLGFLCLVMGVNGIVAAAEVEPLRVMTFNIRYGTAPDGENDWLHRKELVFRVIREFRPHVLGVQEAIASQLDQLAEEFPDLVALGVGREPDGTGEYSALLFDRQRLDCLESGTFWLSEQPEECGSRSWGNHFPRICCWGQFVDRSANKTFRAYNTHWDHESQEARVGSGKLIAQRLSDFAREQPVLLMGDFNVGFADPSRKPFEQPGLQDTFFQVHDTKTEIGTFNGFRGDRKGLKIDTVYINDKFETLSTTIDRTDLKARTPSDHYPVTATVRYVDGN